MLGDKNNKPKAKIWFNQIIIQKGKRSSSGKTVRRELKQGRVELLNSDYTARIEYSADIAQQKHNYNATAKGADIGNFLKKKFRL